ncbi:MAG: hypothetical protein ACRD1X_12320 [Vicinamibacteria bacterium]
MAETAALAMRDKIVPLVDGDQVVVQRWSWAKSMAIFKRLGELLGDDSGGNLADFAGKKTLDVARRAVELLGGRIVDLIRLSVRPEDAEKVTEELPLEDVLTLLEAVVELNLTEGLQKKAASLWRRFRPTSGANGKSS